MTGRVVVMGVSGAGKTTLARALAAGLGWRFVEGAALHPPANLAKMVAAIPLDDADRRPFLERVGDAIADAPVVASCSALKRVYRDLLRARAGAITFVLPRLDQGQLETRLRDRRGHFMPAALLDSQLATLEPPRADEAAITIDGTASVEAQVAAVLARLRDMRAAA